MICEPDPAKPVDEPNARAQLTVHVAVEICSLHVRLPPSSVAPFVGAGKATPAIAPAPPPVPFVLGASKASPAIPPAPPHVFAASLKYDWMKFSNSDLYPWQPNSPPDGPENLILMAPVGRSSSRLISHLRAHLSLFHEVPSRRVQHKPPTKLPHLISTLRLVVGGS